MARAASHPVPEIRRLVVGPFVQNVFLAFCPRTKDAVIVDPGFEPERALRLVEEEGVRVREVIATHGHIDHCWGAVPMCAKTGAPFRMHDADLYWIDAIERQAEMFGLEPPPGRPKLDRPLADGETIRFGDCALRVVHTPGHTPGSVCLHDGTRTLFSGDLLFQGSVGRTDFPGGDTATLVKSIRERVFSLDAATLVLPGHGPDTTVGEEKRTNPFVGDDAGPMPDGPRASMM